MLQAWAKEYEAKTKQPLTARQTAVYKSIVKFNKKHGRAPTYEELASQHGWKSKGTSFFYIHKLIEKGWMYEDSHGNVIPKDICQPDMVW